MSQVPDDRHELEELLPWYAAGTLSRAEAERVEAALARDPELSNQLSMVRAEMIGAIQLNESLGSPRADAMQKLFAKIDAEPASVRMKAYSLADRIVAFLAELSPGARFAIAFAVAAVIVVQSAVIGAGLLRVRNSTYETASAPAPEAAQGSFVLVKFSQEATAASITAFLEANGATIVDGPSGGGFYRLRVSKTVLSEDALSNLVRRMQRNSTVSFVVASE